MLRMKNLIITLKLFVVLDCNLFICFIYFYMLQTNLSVLLKSVRLWYTCLGSVL
jgi:hypothetical protein